MKNELLTSEPLFDDSSGAGATSTPDSLRVALLINMAPRKLGSLEDWIVAVCAEAIRRGHSIDVYTRPAKHPAFDRQLRALGVSWFSVDDLEESFFDGVRQLKKYDAIHVNMFHPRQRVVLQAFAAAPAKVFWVDHSSGVPSRRPEAIQRIMRAVDRVSNVRLAGIAGVSNYVRDRNLARFGDGSVPIRTVYNGVDLARFSPPQKEEPRPYFSILSVAYLIRHKGMHVLLGALARMRSKQNVLLRIAGDGPELEALRKQTSKLGLTPFVEFLGLRDDVEQLLANSDAFVHPAVWEEAFGLTIAEAMAMGKAIVATRTGGIPELIEDGVSGLLVAPNDEVSLARALERVFASPPLRQSLGLAARARAVARFGLSRCAADHLSWVEELCGVRAPAPVERAAARNQVRVGGPEVVATKEIVELPRELPPPAA